jgi:hypothetical protein
MTEPTQLHALTGPVETEPINVGGFVDIDAFFDDTLTVPMRGKLYTIPPADAATGLLCQRLMAVGINAAAGKSPDATRAAQLNDADEADLMCRLLGGQQWLDSDQTQPNPAYDPAKDVWAEMFADGLDWQRIKHVGTTAMLWAAFDKDTALAYWKSGGAAAPKPQPQPRQPQDRRATAKSAQQGSRAGTTTPRKRAAKKASPGKTS